MADRTSTTYATLDAHWNAALALARWEQAPDLAITTDGTAYMVGPTGPDHRPGWWQTSPEEIELLTMQPNFLPDAQR